MATQITNLWHSFGLFDDWFSTLNTIFNIWLIVAQIRSHYKIKHLEKENIQLKQLNSMLLSSESSHQPPKGL